LQAVWDGAPTESGLVELAAEPDLTFRFR